MLLAPKLAATVLAVVVNVATLSVLCSPAHADPLPPPIPPIDDRGLVNATWSKLEPLFDCYNIDEGGIEAGVCVGDPMDSLP